MEKNEKKTRRKWENCKKIENILIRASWEYFYENIFCFFFCIALIIVVVANIASRTQQQLLVVYGWSSNHII